MRRVLTLAAAVATLACLAAEPAAGAFPGRPGHIAFSRSGTGSFPSNADIWVSNRNGGHQHRLTGTRSADETSPVFSPNGHLILFVRRSGGDADVWVMHANGSHERQLTFSDDSEFQPAWYPSGRSILFTRFDGSRGWTIYSRRLGSPVNLKLVKDNATFPIVSPNGRWFAYSATQDGIGGIRLESRRSGHTSRLTTGSAQDLDFSPNSRRIVFTGQRHCARGNSDLRFSVLTIGINDKRADIIRRSCDREFISPAWSPNGRKLVFAHKKLATHGANLRFRIGIMLPGGTQVGGAPHHRRGTNELDPSWQPRPR
jgi:Tol biopolymer transport system component